MELRFPQKRTLGVVLRTGERIHIYKMAIELDPEFAIAYARLGGVH
jgi:hypothetical protein